MKVGIRKNKLKKGFSYTVYIDYGIVNGQRKREPLETFSQKSIAEKYYSKIETQISNNTFTYIPDISFSEAIDEWMHNYVENELEETTIGGYRIINENYLKPCLGHIPLKVFNNSVSVDIINNYYSYLLSELSNKTVVDKKTGKKKRKKNLTYKSVEHHKAQISGILSYFCRKGQLDRNICLNSVIPKPTNKDIVIENIEEIDDYSIFDDKDGLTPEQAITILNLFMNTEMMLPVALAMFLGLRRSEALGILKNKINKEKQMICINATRVRVGKKTIYKQRTKNKTSSRIIYIPKILLSIIELDEKRQENNKKIYGADYFDSKFLCVMDNGKPINPDYVSRTFNSKLKKYIEKHQKEDKDFKFPKVTFHTLRHLNINALLENGALITDVQKNSGHSDIHTTIGYTYNYSQGKKSVAEKTDEIYSNLIEISS